MPVIRFVSGQKLWPGCLSSADHVKPLIEDPPAQPFLEDPMSSSLASWPAIEKACYDMVPVLAWDCVYNYTSQAHRAFFRRHYRWESTRPEAGSQTGTVYAGLTPEQLRTKPAADEELYDMACSAAGHSISLLKERFHRSTPTNRPIGFPSRNHLYSYLRKTLVGTIQPDGSLFPPGIYTRKLRIEIKRLSTQDSLDCPEAVQPPARPADPDTVMFLRRTIAAELQAWLQFCDDLAEPSRATADALAAYFLARLRSSCADPTASMATVLDSWIPGGFELPTLKEFKDAFRTTNPLVTSNAFDSRINSLRVRWQQWLEGHGVDPAERPVMRRLLTSQPSRLRLKEDRQ